MNLTEIIQNALIGSKLPIIGSLEQKLTELAGRKIQWYDTVIDDGADGDETEDQYVMKACFSAEDDSIIVRVFYGDVTKEIGYVDVEKK